MFFSKTSKFRCPLSVGLTGDLMHNSCFGWHAFVLISVGLLVSGPYALITSAISTELGTHKKLKGSKALATVSAIINGTGSIGKLQFLIIYFIMIFNMMSLCESLYSSK